MQLISYEIEIKVKSGSKLHRCFIPNYFALISVDVSSALRVPSVLLQAAALVYCKFKLGVKPFPTLLLIAASLFSTVIGN